MAKYTRVDVITSPNQRVIDNPGHSDDRTLRVECWFHPEDAALTAHLASPTGGPIHPAHNDQVPGHASLTFTGLNVGLPYILTVTATVVDDDGTTVGFDSNKRFVRQALS